MGDGSLWSTQGHNIFLLILSFNSTFLVSCDVEIKMLVQCDNCNLHCSQSIADPSVLNKDLHKSIIKLLDSFNLH